MAKILIIDDEREICLVLTKFLQRQGHEVITAMDGTRGLAAAMENPDLIICDLAMPGLNGQGVLNALRQDKRMEDIPFIFYSGSANHEMVRQCMNLGGDDFIAKPAELPEILDAVNSRLWRRQQRLRRQREAVEKAVQIFAGIVNDLGSSDAAFQWLADVATRESAAESSQVSSSAAAAENTLPATACSPDTTFLARQDNRRYFVKLSDVKVLLADGEYSRAYWGKNQNMMFRKPLKQWEKELPPEYFVRVHRKAIINLAFLDFVGRAESGKPTVHIKDFQAAIEVSQRKVPWLNKRLKTFQPEK